MDHDSRIDMLTNLPPELRERIKASRAEEQARHQTGIDQTAQAKALEFIYQGFVQPIHRTPEGRIDPEKSQSVISKWQRGDGTTVYLSGTPDEVIPETPEDRINTLSKRIQAQQAGFIALDPSEQARIRTGFSSPGSTDSRFRAYLTNEALAQQFQKLK